MRGTARDLRSVTMLWQNVEQFVVLADKAKTGTIADLTGMKGERMSFGAKNSGTLGSNEFLLNNLGIDAGATYDLVYVGYGPSADALQNGQIAGMSIPAGAPTSAVTRAFAALGDKVKMLDFTDEQVQKADGGLNLWTRYVIKAGTYPGQEKDVQTIAQPNFLAVRADVDEDAVYLITKTIYENLPFLNAIHQATKVMALEKAIAGLPMPLHPGALKYYKEAGLDIPERLMPQ
jgi:TRAP transporter TAXI family solute receptor